uniref:Uncharacterized protein n=1 Tax=Anguilla anguilla TaxID=7936 RepID=A0A0E9VS86_ANGAN
MRKGPTVFENDLLVGVCVCAQVNIKIRPEAGWAACLCHVMKIVCHTLSISQ